MAGPEHDVLPPGGRWRRHEHHATVGSTNDVGLAALAEDGPGLVVTADVQTAGRGRRGRVWQDRDGGANLASTATLAPVGDHATLVPLATGLAAATALQRLDVPAVLKWPNDVVVEQGTTYAKLCGILVESVVEGLAVGVGWNVDHRGREPLPGATSAAQAAGHDVDRWSLFGAYLSRLDVLLGRAEDDPAAIVDAYRPLCSTLGRRVTATVPGGRVAGEAVDVGDDGALLVRRADGDVVRVSSGEVVHLR